MLLYVLNYVSILIELNLYHLIFEFTVIIHIFGYAKKDNTRNSREC